MIRDSRLFEPIDGEWVDNCEATESGRLYASSTAVGGDGEDGFDDKFIVWRFGVGV